MSTEDNKAVVQRAFDSMTEGPKAFEAEHDAIYDPSLAGHFAGMPLVGIEMHRQFGLATFDAFPDLVRTVEDMVAEGDKVVARWTSTGTHAGLFMGIPPTGKTIMTSGITVFRFNDAGRIVEEWSESDMVGMLQQVGAMPSPGG